MPTIKIIMRLPATMSIEANASMARTQTDRAGAIVRKAGFPAASAALALIACMLLCPSDASADETTATRYFAHEFSTDANGVIAPWYKGQNGQCDLRVRIAAETLKRYPWALPPKTPAPVPDYIYNGHWVLDKDGSITVPELKDWDNGDFGQRAAYSLGALNSYYRYSGDPAAIAHLTMIADTIVDHCLTPTDHPWPGVLVSVPVRGKAYGPFNTHGFIQLDIVASVGTELVHASQLTGNARWLETAKKWGDLFAKYRNKKPAPGESPWNRYANPQDVPWEDQQTGAVIAIAEFLDELIHLGYTGTDNAIVESRNAALDYVRNELLPRWDESDTWGRQYWDWLNPIECVCVVANVARFMTAHPDDFPLWRSDVRNVLTIFMHRASSNRTADADFYHGAWAYPESLSCCDRSLSYSPQELAPVFAQYGVTAKSAWGREMARRQILLSTYDAHENGVVEDSVTGGQIVSASWNKITVPWALKDALDTMGWLPEILGPARENHVMRTTSIVSHVAYRRGRVEFTVAEAPSNSISVLRLALRPTRVLADGRELPLSAQADLKANGYAVTPLPCGDAIMTVRHDGKTRICVEGDDPQKETSANALQLTGEWRPVGEAEGRPLQVRTTVTSGSAATCQFSGNQVRVIGCAGPAGGLADVTLDGAKQRVQIDCWNPAERADQVLFYMNGLPAGQHTLTLTALGAGNPRSEGSSVTIAAVQSSAAEGTPDFGAGQGPTGTQRVVLGTTWRPDYVDSEGNAWSPATEVIVRGAGKGTDVVNSSWWKRARRIHIEGTPDPQLYQHGLHGKDFTAYFTVAPGRYHIRLKFCETRALDAAPPEARAFDIHVNGTQMVRDLDVAATAWGKPKAELTMEKPFKIWKGKDTAVDLVFDDVEPVQGVIAIRFLATKGEAIVQAIEVGPGKGRGGAIPICLTR